MARALWCRYHRRMEPFVRRAFLVCAAAVLGILASPLTAQQTIPDQQTTPSVPPAPPPDRQTSPSVPPPFPPMPAREPRHRFVDMGDHRTSHAHHRTTKASHRTTSSKHRATSKQRPTSKHGATHEHGRASTRHRVTSRHHAVAPSMSKKAIRQCHSMSYRQLLRHKNCAALLQSELNAASHAKHRSGKHKTSAKRHKTVSRHETRRSTTVRHRRH